jgi:type I restriction enzyme S subunit
MKRIGDILTRNKTAVVVEDGTSYKQVTIRTNYKGVVLRGTQDGSTILTKNQCAVSAGQFILSRIDARNGAFGIIPEELEGAIVTNDFLAFDINEDEVEREFFNVFLQSPVFLEACIKASRGNTNRKRVDEGFFLNYQVNLPPISDQHELIKQINKGRTKLALAQHEITHQQSLLAKLKQAILQEAIQGKLSADWRAAHPDVEPASQLLHRIQADKARLIAAKKLRPEKPLPKITPAEIPFEIPEGWEWCRFGRITRAYEAGSSFKCEDREVVGEEWGVIKTSAVTSGDFAERENKFLRTDAPADTTAQVAVGDLIFCRASGSKGLAGKCAIVRECSRNLLLSDKTIRVPLMEGISQEYIALHNDSAQAKAYFAGLGMGKSTSMNNVTRDDLFMKPIPLPPLAEQAAIVERVEALMTTCRALEAEIEHARTHSAHLLQAVLKEAFAPATGHSRAGSASLGLASA